MLHRVVKPFPCSWDGVTLEPLVEGDERDFGSMAAGLVAEGWIAVIAGEPDEPPFEMAVVDTAPIETAVVKHAPRGRRGR